MEPILDDEALDRLRDAIRDLRDHEGGALPHDKVAAFAASLGPETRVTLDLAASDVVGVPLLVVARQRKPAAPSGLTPRELAVAELLGSGLTNKAIAVRLALSPATVKDHVHHILQKTGLPSRAAVVAHLAASVIEEKDRA